MEGILLSEQKECKGMLLVAIEAPVIAALDSLGYDVLDSRSVSPTLLSLFVEKLVYAKFELHMPMLTQ